MKDVLVEISEVKKYFGGVKALDGVTLTLHKGEIRCLAGENGCGKSTLIKILSGTYKRDSGRIVIAGSEIDHLTPHSSMQLGIQVVYQDLSLFPNLTVAENILFSDQLDQNRKFVHWRSLFSMAKNALETIKVDIDPQDRIGSLTLAQKQLVAIAKALYHEAKLVILDEPTTSLTNKEIDLLFAVLAELKERDVSILLVSHKLREVLKISETLTIMRNGKIVTDGPTTDFDEKKISYLMTGRELLKRPNVEKIPRVGVPLLEVKGFSKEGAFSQIDFSIWPGEILGITGLLGSGRAEVAKSIVGLEQPDSGELLLSGKPIINRSVEDAVRQGIGYVPEDRLTEGLFHEQSVQDNMIVTSMGLFKTNTLGDLDITKIDTAVDQAALEFNVKMKDKHSSIQSLSGGNAQKVVLARWLLAQVDVLFLNGPTVGVDIGAKFEIYEKIKQLSKDGLSLVIISDDVPELVENCHRILVMHKGCIIKELPEGTITEDRIYEVLGSLS
jgi:simple sugar transport system ATP-binding protein